MSVVRSGRIAGAASVLREILCELRKQNVPFMAGSVAYSAFVSLLPMMLLVLLVASALGGETLARYVVDFSDEYLTPAGQEILTDAIRQAASRTEVPIVGVLVLGWGLLRVLRAIDTAFSTLYGNEADNGLVDQLRDSVVVLGAITVALVAMLAASAAFAAFPDLPYLGVLNPLLLAVGLSVAFLPIYYVYPERDLAVWQVLPGTVVAAVGWAVLQVGFQVYVSFTSTAEVYGVIGGVLLIVTWLYFGALLLLLGATVNVVLTRRREPSPPSLTAA